MLLFKNFENPRSGLEFFPMGQRVSKSHFTPTINNKNGTNNKKTILRH